MASLRLLVVCAIAFLCFFQKGVNGTYHNGTHYTRRVVHHHTGAPSLAGGLRRTGNNFVNGAKRVGGNIGPLGGVFNGLGNVVNYAVNGTNSLIDNANDFAASTVKGAYNGVQNIGKDRLKTESVAFTNDKIIRKEAVI
ncbi:hypothetical protein NPIL_594511 [Nephila pilipes]|uniref:Uncharacterized protein n=1 Tax=Nephila pilipes TaxID=299642 RepID=A0A8X6MA00_NEPPI|nr:hypothetical protein NPIL_594511 [Nephila pilipes]